MDEREERERGDRDFLVPSAGGRNIHSILSPFHSMNNDCFEERRERMERKRRKEKEEKKEGQMKRRDRVVLTLFQALSVTESFSLSLLTVSDAICSLTQSIGWSI